MIIFVYACDLKGGIGKDGDLPWKQSTDLQHFKRVTLGGTIVMGRKTWESIPSQYQPLNNRINVVLTSRENYFSKGTPTNTYATSSLDKAIEFVKDYSEKIELNSERDNLKNLTQWSKLLDE